MRKITEVTRKRIAELFRYEFDYWVDDSGRVREIEFIERLYNLEELPSTDSRFENAKEEISQHRIKDFDWDNHWIFQDERFNLDNGNDDAYLLKFLCETLNPDVRKSDDVKELLKIYNEILSVDGYEIFEIERLSNRPVFGFREVNSKTISRNSILMKPIQKILFGSPGTGKSYQIRQIAQEQLNIYIDETSKTSSNIVKAVFHPEYTYADFMGKLLPFTQGNSVIYKFYSGHFLKILGKAYKSLIDGENENYLLVIDELNRGNSAAIFGNIFQLLDRESDGWSSYEIDISEMELVGLFQAMNLLKTVEVNSEGKIKIKFNEHSGEFEYLTALENKSKNLKNEGNNNGIIICKILQQCQIKLPPNLSIIATINTSDESIYYLDTAFKRRWDWEFVKVPVGDFNDDDIPEEMLDVKLIFNDLSTEFWSYYIVGINELIKSNYQTIRRIEDKLIGWWFIKPEENKIELQKVQNKVMFYLWDSVFARDKRPLEIFLSDDENSSVKLALYSDFLALTEKFLKKVYDLGEKQYKG